MFAEFLLCSSLASINSNKCYGVTEMWCSAVTWRSRGLFSRSGSEKKNAVGAIFFIQHLISLRQSICLVLGTALDLCHSCEVGAQCLLKLSSTITLILQIYIYELRICACGTILAPHLQKCVSDVLYLFLAWCVLYLQRKRLHSALGAWIDILSQPICCSGHTV